MRLLDTVAHAQTPMVLALRGMAARCFAVTSPAEYRQLIVECPLRFVLGDDLTRASAELAFAEGTRLADCLDLMRIPAPAMWIEWNDGPHQRVVFETHSAAEYDVHASGRRVGIFLTSDSQGETALLRTFWTDKVESGGSAVNMSPLETHIDLRGRFAAESDIAGVLAGGFARVRDFAGKSAATLLDCVRFRFDNRWAAYYKSAATSPAVQREVVHASLATVARDAPFILGFFLLLSAKDATRAVPISRALINRKRRAHGRQPLLDHVELNACLETLHTSGHAVRGSTGRHSPRLHHVRGHLVRRDNQVFWRVPHLRGSAARGVVRSRTVCLSFVRST